MTAEKGRRSRTGRLAVAVLLVAGALLAALGGRPLSPPGMKSALAQPAGAPPAGGGLDISYRYISVGWIDWASVQLKEALELRPGMLEARMILGMAEEALGNPEAALAAYEKAAEAGRGRPEGEGAALALAGNLLLASDRVAEAKEALLRAHAASPDSALILYNLGLIAEREGDEGAIDWYVQAGEASPGWIEPTVRAGALLSARGEYGRAAEVLVRGAAAGVRHAEYHFQLGLVGLRLLESVRRGELSPDGERALAALEIAVDEAEKSLRDLIDHAADRLFQLDPDHPGVERLLGSLARL